MSADGDMLGELICELLHKILMKLGDIEALLIEEDEEELEAGASDSPGPGPELKKAQAKLEPHKTSLLGSKDRESYVV